MASDKLNGALSGSGDYTGGGLESRAGSGGLAGVTPEAGLDSAVSQGNSYETGDSLTDALGDTPTDLNGGTVGSSSSTNPSTSNTSSVNKQTGIPKKSANDILADDAKRQREAFNRKQAQKARNERRLRNYRNKMDAGQGDGTGLAGRLADERTPSDPNANIRDLRDMKSPWEQGGANNKLGKPAQLGDASQLDRPNTLESALSQDKGNQLQRSTAMKQPTPQNNMEPTKKVNAIQPQKGPVNNLDANLGNGAGGLGTATIPAPANGTPIDETNDPNQPSAVAPGEAGKTKGNGKGAMKGSGKGKSSKTKGLVKGAGKLGWKTAKGTIKLSSKLVKRLFLWLALTNVVGIIIIFLMVLVAGTAVIIMANVEPFRGQLKAANMLGDEKIVTLPKSMIGNIAGGVGGSDSGSSSGGSGSSSKGKSDDSDDKSDSSGADFSGNSVVSASKAKKLIWKLIRSKGYSAAATAGIMGNMRAESNFNTKALNPTSSASGLVQWLPDRWSNELKYAKKMKKDPYSVEAQVGFMFHEIKDPYYGGKLNVGSSFGKASDPKTACMTWYNAFERGGPAQVGNRATYAEAIYKEFK